MPANTLSGIICDEIRQESNGKFILLGVYCGLIEYEGPANAPPPYEEIAFYIEARISEETEYEFTFGLRGADPILEYGGKIGFSKEDLLEGMTATTVPIPFNARRVVFDEPGDYVLCGRPKGKKFVELACLTISINPNVR